MNKIEKLKALLSAGGSCFNVPFQCRECPLRLDDLCNDNMWVPTDKVFEMSTNLLNRIKKKKKIKEILK